MVRQQKPGMSAEQLKDILSRRGKDPEINLLLREISYMRRILRETDQFLVMIDDMPWHDERKKRMYEGLSIAVRQHKAVKEWRRQQKTISELTQVHQPS